MSKKAQGKPWHSKEGTVYHDNSMCAERKKMLERLEGIEGAGRKPLCPECGRLNNMP